MKQAFFSISLAFGIIYSSQAKQLPPFQLKDGDRVAFLGDTLIERMQEFNHLAIPTAELPATMWSYWRYTQFLEAMVGHLSSLPSAAVGSRVSATGMGSR